jgi:hypothetical protein
MERRRQQDRDRKRLMNAADPDAARERSRARRANETPEQRERRLAYLRDWQSRHPERQRQWRAEHPGYNAARMRAARAEDPTTVRYAQKKWRLKSKYGISIEAYEQMLADQDGRCGICRREERLVIKGTTCTLAVDHDAATGRVRGLLCVNCNMAIGGLQHAPTLLRAAIVYLEG